MICLEVVTFQLNKCQVNTSSFSYLMKDEGFLFCFVLLLSFPFKILKIKIVIMSGWIEHEQFVQMSMRPYTPRIHPAVCNEMPSVLEGIILSISVFCTKSSMKCCKLYIS